ncbi:DnaJ-domain-containing protein [Pyrenochaeta sp. DS3sAY3a]|nr:DnaJ-domain-containing protein [Pyrenochaeta sp. DS3sAY3a]
MPKVPKDYRISGSVKTKRPKLPEEIEEGQEDERNEEQRELKDYQPDSRKKEILRILQWPENAYYEILDVPENAHETDIKSAWRRKSNLTHTDRNNDVQAKEVIQRVNQAYEILYDAEKREKYDTERVFLLMNKLLIPKEFDETFEQGAYDPDTEMGESDGSDIDESAMSKEKEAIIQEMTPCVQSLLNSGDPEAQSDLQRLNDRLIKQNQLEGIFATNHCPPIKTFRKMADKRMRLLEIISKRDSHMQKAKEELENLRRRLQSQIEELELPREWDFDDLEEGNIVDADFKGPIAAEWKPGLTERGEKILAYRSITKTVTERGTEREVVTETVNDFIIELVGERNPIAIADVARVGLQASRAYTELPNEQKFCVTNIAQQFDRTHGKKINKIKGFAQKYPSSWTGIRPWGVVLIDFEGNDMVINRSALRKALPGIADKLIDQFLIDIGEPPGEPRSMLLRKRIEHAERQLQIEGSRRQLEISNRPHYISRPRDRLETSDDDSDFDTRSTKSVRRQVPMKHKDVVTRNELDTMMRNLEQRIVDKLKELQLQPR